MAKILLGVTGSVAAIRTPALFEALQLAGHDVKVVATTPATYFFDVNSIGSKGKKRDPEVMILDEDEWPGEKYQRNDRVLHIELRNWANLFLIAPLDANTLAKLAYGLSDNCLTCVWRAWDQEKPVVLAPAMNTLMWESPITRMHLDLLEEISASTQFLSIINPIEKTLACGDIGVGAMAEVPAIVDWVGTKVS